jgi:hypothetical protein
VTQILKHPSLPTFYYAEIISEEIGTPFMKISLLYQTIISFYVILCRVKIKTRCGAGIHIEIYPTFSHHNISKQNRGAVQLLATGVKKKKKLWKKLSKQLSMMLSGLFASVNVSWPGRHVCTAA